MPFLSFAFAGGERGVGVRREMKKKRNVCVDMTHTLGKPQIGSTLSCLGGKCVVVRSLSDVKKTQFYREYR